MVLTQPQRGVLNNAINLTTQQKHKEIVSILQELTPLSPHLVSEHFFGDKTALDMLRIDRINVRRLFLTIEQAPKEQHSQLELNDELTRANFRNIVEPYLRDIEARGLLDSSLFAQHEQHS